MRLSIIIVSWNVKVHLDACIESILRHPPVAEYEIIVVDNASTDGTAVEIRGKYPDVEVVTNFNNAGFARANNQGVALAAGDYLFILNPDTLFLPNSVNELIAFMDHHPEIGICGPRVLNEDFTLQRSVRGFPTWSMAFARHTLLGKLGMFRGSLAAWRCRDFDYALQADVEQLIGAAMLVRRDVFERVGGFDERFFMYYEEVDLCKRIKEAGHRVVYYPGAEIIHLGGKSSGQIPAGKRLMMLNSLLRYLQKNTSRVYYPVLSVIFKFGVLLSNFLNFSKYLIAFVFFFLARDEGEMSKYARRLSTENKFLFRCSINFVRGREC